MSTRENVFPNNPRWGVVQQVARGRKGPHGRTSEFTDERRKPSWNVCLCSSKGPTLASLQALKFHWKGIWWACSQRLVPSATEEIGKAFCTSWLSDGFSLKITPRARAKLRLGAGAQTEEGPESITSTIQNKNNSNNKISRLCLLLWSLHFLLPALLLLFNI